MDIRRINKEMAWELRHVVMWPDKDVDYVKLQDDDEGIHYGLFSNERVVSVISLFVDGDEAQFRKFATLRHEQGKGYGSKLLQYVLDEAQSMGIERIWCNARKNKAPFYAKFGLAQTPSIFSKGGIEYVIMEKLMK
ncbi:GNAT family N-acetyltransferase [Paenibacillus beijingensis]|uniref:GNAT family acetyltransferase n=1 Tax=Paenibacillus beijingensis TaxID=1126833 RepID=A0A0D5NKJ3_9BACL|nr:GNAT family N-acetyltransferase [Paenibacillus beijingensis]AJY75630.1 GNAT family acetyltransferase [Paenibacillus beijingensis]